MAYKMKKVLLVTLALLCKLDLLLTANANIWDYSNLLFPYHPWFIPIVSFLYPDKNRSSYSGYMQNCQHRRICQKLFTC